MMDTIIYAEPDDGLNLTTLFPAPVREIVVVQRDGGSDVHVCEDGVSRWEYWCEDADALERTLAYVRWIYPGVEMREE